MNTRSDRRSSPRFGQGSPLKRGRRPVRTERASPGARRALALLGTLSLLGALSLLGPTAGSAQEVAADLDGPPAGLVIDAVTVVDVRTGRRLAGRTVAIADGRIRRIVASRSPAADSLAAAARAADRLVDGVGLYLIPGLWDMHAHVLPTSGPADAWWEPDPEHAAHLLLANGVTGVRDMWGSLEAATRWRERGGSAPRLIAPGGIIDGPYPWFPGLLSASSGGDARRLVDSLAAGGADFIKVYNALPPDLLDDVVERARGHGLDVVGHVPNTMSALDAAEAGMAGFEHLHGVLEACSTEEPWLLRDNLAYLNARAAGRSGQTDNRTYFERLLDTQSEHHCGDFIDRLAELGVTQTPTLVAHFGPLRLRDPTAADDPRLAYVPDAVSRFWQPGTYEATRGFGAYDWRLAERRLERMREVVGRMRTAGVKLLAGTDYHPTLAYTFPGFSLHEELELLVDAGLSPLEALQAATLEPARTIGDRLRGPPAGVIEPGRAADLVLLSDDPLEDIRHTRRIVGVVRGGRWLPADTLTTWKRRVTEAYESSIRREPEPLPPGAARVVAGGERRGEFRYVFLLDPDLVEQSLPGFAELVPARRIARSDPGLESFLTVNPQYRDWSVAGLEIGSYEDVTADEREATSVPSGGRRTSIARWWVLAENPGIYGLDAAPDRTMVELGRWSAAGPGDSRVWVRSYESGAWAFHLESIELTVDVVCRPGGARWHETFAPDALVLPGERIPDRYFRERAAGEIKRDCSTQLSARGLSPLATTLREAPYVVGTLLGARLIEGGMWRRGTYITE